MGKDDQGRFIEVRSLSDILPDKKDNQATKSARAQGWAQYKSREPKRAQTKHPSNIDIQNELVSIYP